MLGMASKRQISQGAVAAILLFIVLSTRMGGNIFVPSIPAIADEFGIDNARATFNINLYSIVLALSFAFFGPFADVVKKRLLLLFGSLLCMFSYLICGLAINIWMIDLGRVIMAAGGAIIILTAQTWIGDRSGKANLLSRLAWFSMLVALAPMLAPVLGGYITDQFSWRWNFWLMLILSIVVIAIIMVIKSSKEDQPKSKITLHPVDLLKTYSEVTLKTPLFRLNALVFSLFMLQGAYITFSSFLFIHEMGFSAAQYGMVSLFMVGGLFLGRLPTMYLEKRFSIRMVMMMNTVVVVLSLLGSLLFNYVEGQHTANEIIVSMTLMCLGFSGLSILSTRNSMVLDPARKGTFSGLYSFLSQLSGWIGVVLTQLFYHFKFPSSSIYNYFLILSLVLIAMGVYLFLKVYPHVKVVLEKE
jgi:DHA1 family bicyclomycin/chloramphenicol resistance-like MFS transporter